MQGIITRGVGGFYYVLDAAGALHQLRAQEELRRARIKPMVGDVVEFAPGAQQEQDGWLTAILPRKNALRRPPVANIDAVVIVVAAAAPDPDLLMADRLLIAARAAGIRALLAINKADLAMENARVIARQYCAAQVEPTLVCARTGEGVAELRAKLRGCVHALAGQSGAGKSTLLNALYGLDLTTGDVSQRIERGRHTTRQCQLIPLGDGTMALDTPGFSLLESDLRDPVALKDDYPEFRPYEGKCRFAPCYHAQEPYCAVREAVQAGQIDPERHARYVELLEEMRIRWRDRYG